MNAKSVQRKKIIKNKRKTIRFTSHTVNIITSMGIFEGDICVVENENRKFMLNSVRCNNNSDIILNFETQEGSVMDICHSKVKVCINDIELLGFSMPKQRYGINEIYKKFENFNKILNRVIKANSHLMIEKNILKNHKNNIEKNINKFDDGGGDNEIWVISFLFPEISSSKSVGTDIINNIDYIDRQLSNKYPLLIVGVDDTGKFNEELFRDFCNFFSAISDFDWTGETSLLTMKYTYITDENYKFAYNQDRVILDISNVYIHKFDSLLSKNVYSNYMSIIMEMNNIVKRCKTADGVFKAIKKRQLYSKGGIIMTSLIKEIGKSLLATLAVKFM